MVARLLEVFWQESEGGVETVWLEPFNGSSLQSQPPGVEAGHQGCPGGRALWGDVGVGEAHSIRAQLFHVRCFEARVVP